MPRAIRYLARLANDPATEQRLRYGVVIVDHAVVLRLAMRREEPWDFRHSAW